MIESKRMAWAERIAHMGEMRYCIFSISFHLSLRLSSGLYPQTFLTKMLYSLLSVHELAKYKLVIKIVYYEYDLFL